MITTEEDPVLFEVTTTLQEWHKIWISLYLDNKTNLFEQVGTILNQLIDARLELLDFLDLNNNHYYQIKDDASSGDQQLYELKKNIVERLDYGNRLLGLDLVPRDAEFNLVDPVKLSPIKLYHLHKKAALNITSRLDSVDNDSSNILNSIDNQNTSGLNSTNLPAYHLQLSLKNHHLASIPPDESLEIYLSLVDTYANNPYTTIKSFTEKFLVKITNEELVSGAPNTIFTNIGASINRDIYLYVQVCRLGKMTLVDGNKATFGRQSNGQSVATQDGSTNSINSSYKYTPNGSNKIYNPTTGSNSLYKYRRPFGSTMILLKESTKSVSIKECNLGVKITSSSESGFSQLNDLYAKRNHTLKVYQNVSNVQFDLAYRFITCSEESLSKSISISPYCLTPKKGYPDIVMPGDFKNDLYFTLDSAEFEKGGKSISKNIEASISLIDKDGQVVENCISTSSNCDNISNYNSCVYYHSNSPKWNESIKIKVPLSRFDGAHIRIEFRHCSTKDRDKKFIGFSFLPLSDEDGTVIADKTHELYLYKYDSQSLEDDASNLLKYATLPFGPAGDTQSKSRTTSLPNFTHSSREIVMVNTSFLSTKLTQNSNLLNLLKWRELIKRDNKDFEEALKKVLVINGEEIVKFLQDILDTLFDTFTLYSTSGDDKSALIFKVLVHIFLLIDEPKYQHFKPVLDTYASAHFSATLVYKGLLACVKKCLDYSSDVKRHVPIQKCFKSIKYVFQFIVQSKLLYSKATGDPIDVPFLNDLEELFQQFESMLSDSNPSLIPIQVTFLESFPRSLEQLIKVMKAKDLAELVTSLAGSVGFRLPPALSRAKLIFMRETANSQLIKNQEVRIQITEKFCRHLDCYITHSEELELCHEVLEILIMKIHDYHWPAIYWSYQLTVEKSNPEEVSMIKEGSIMTVGDIFLNTRLIPTNPLDQPILSVSKEIEPFVILLESLFYLTDTLVKDPNVDRVLVQKYGTCLLTIMKLMSKLNFDRFNQRRKTDPPKLELGLPQLSNLFKSFRELYNRDWSVMQLTSHSILESPIDEIFKELKTKPPVDGQLESYIKLVADYITHPTLQVESFSDRKRSYVLNVFGDLRLKFTAHLMKFWNDLTLAIINKLVPTSIPAFLDVAMLPNNDLLQMIVPAFYDMINSEVRFKSKINELEYCLMDNIDSLFNLDRGDQKFIDNFSYLMSDSIRKKTPPWEDQGLKFINSLSELMTLLLGYRQSLEKNENQSKQMNYLMGLLNFYRDKKRTQLYLKYLFKLRDMHLAAGNHVEAAFTLKLYTDDLEWCNKMLVPLEGYRTEEQEWKRKEFLYQRIIHYFDLGKCWEESIGLCKELAVFYETYLLDYEKLSNILKRRAQLLDNILSEHRPEREYFRVEFIGTDLPDFVIGKEFIYRGGEYERLAAFIQRITSEFPDAKILNFKTKQSVAKDVRGQYIVISNVKAVPFLQDHLKSGQKNIDDRIIQYFLNNRLNTFSYDVPILKGNSTSSKENTSEINAKNLWVGRYMLKLKKQLPDILPWGEVISQEFIEISPINHAIETISSMNLELIKLIQSFKNEPTKQISPLTMRLQGVIEAAVNGGPAVFINAFLKIQPGETTHQYDQESLLRLRDLIEQQFSILEAGLSLHSKLAPSEVMPLHTRLAERLQSTKKTLLELKRSSFDGKRIQLKEHKYISPSKT